MLGLRFIPAFPFFLVNLIAGITRIRLFTYVVTTMIGIIPGTLLYTYAGRRLGEIREIGDLYRPSVWGALAILGFSIIVPSQLAGYMRKRHQHSGAPFRKGGDTDEKDVSEPPATSRPS
jgi:uncharacterized membrane protein YdjX (TVP38/TMEM64 family)